MDNTKPINAEQPNENKPQLLIYSPPPERFDPYAILRQIRAKEKTFSNLHLKQLPEKMKY